MAVKGTKNVFPGGDHKQKVWSLSSRVSVPTRIRGIQSLFACGEPSMGCFKWFLIILLILAVLAGIVFLVYQFGAIVLWILFGVLLLAAIILAMSGKG
jgi:hypothetical protein